MTDAANDERTPEAVIALTKVWLERAVIGLNLCPFVKAVHVKNRIRYIVSAAHTSEELLADLTRELGLLADAEPEVCDTTLLIHPHVLNDFLDYNDFLEIADTVVDEMSLEGVLQVASFHPDYQFADSAADDVTNCTNRSPYPTLHLLREDSIDRAVEAFPEAERIYATNIETLKRLGKDGWQALWSDKTRN